MQTTEAKHLVHRSKSPGHWFGMDYTMNIYRGCCHGCIYCDSRSDCYRIDDFDTVKAKADALRILRDDLARKATRGVVGTGATSDPYNPFDKEQQLTRHALELLDAYSFGSAIATKSDLIVRDIDVMQSIQAHAPVLCKLTVTTIDDGLAQRLEPHAPSPTRRLAAIEALSRAGIFTGVLLMPVMPFITDKPDMLRELVARAADAGARFIYPGLGVTARSGQREYMLAGLDEAFPGEGLDDKYRSRFGSRYHCTSPNAKALWAVFTDECKKRGVLYDMAEIIRAYKMGYESSQLSFL